MPPLDNLIFSAYTQLQRLLEKGSLKEADYQNCFEQHPITFRILGFDLAAGYEKKSGNRLPYDHDRQRQHEPDFLCADCSSQKVTV